MTDLKQIAAQHVHLSRRFFLQLSAATGAGFHIAAATAGEQPDDPRLAAAVEELEYLTRIENFRIVGRGKPVPSTLSPEKRLEVGLDRKTWKLEVIADPESNAKIDNPLTRQAGNALDWATFMALAEKQTVRFMKVMTCTNMGQPLGMGLWEGVPLRDIIWLARPKANVRRVFYYGYHNDDPAQRFQSSLSINRVLEDPPGEHPVIVCYKLNGHLLTPKAGAPARMIVPEAYGNKSVKWLQHIVLTNNFQENDTYATWNNDTESHLKTCARFLLVPSRIKAGQPLPITGVAQVGMSGLSKVQYCIQPADQPWPKEDPYFTQADWQPATVLAPPENWGGGLPGGRLPEIPRQFDLATGKPKTWPLRDTLVHWSALADALEPGKFEIRCRTVDAHGVAQPMPRPLPKSGANQIQSKKLEVT